MISRRAVLSAAAAMLTAARAAAQNSPQTSPQDAAADYPNRPIKILVSAPPGGGPDIVARIVAEKLRVLWGQPVIVENRSGNAGNLGAETVAAAAPDGYTLLAAQPSPLTTSMFLYTKLNFDPLAFEPVAVMTSFPNLLVVRPGFPADTIQQFLAYAKAHPNAITYASQGPGTTPHLTGEWFARVSGAKLVHVPYRGTAQAVNDLIAGHVDMMFLELAASYELSSAGRGKILAVADEKRVAPFPNVPTLREVGVDIESLAWNALAAPPKTPHAIVLKLNRAVDAMFKTPELVAQFDRMKTHPVGGTLEETAAFLDAERKRWGAVIRASDIKVH